MKYTWFKVYVREFDDPVAEGSNRTEVSKRAQELCPGQELFGEAITEDGKVAGWFPGRHKITALG